MWDDARRRLFRNRAAVASLILLAVLVVAAAVGPWLSPFAYDDLNKDRIWSMPLAYGHVLGTDALGRDLLSRLLLGLRVSLTVGVVATVVSLVIGIAYGATAGYLGGRIDDRLLQRHRSTGRVVW